MRIALVNQWYPPDYRGVSAYNGIIAPAYARLGHEVTVITSRFTPDQPDVTWEDGVRVYRTDLWVEPYSARRLPLIGPHTRSLRHLIYSRKACALLQRLSRCHGFDIVEFAEVNAEGLFAALRGNRVPAVVHCQTPHVLLRQTTLPEDYWFDSRIVEWAEAATVRRAAAVIAPSVDLAQHVEREMRLRPGRVAVIPDPIDTAEFSPPSGAEARAGERPLTILYVGRLQRHKGSFVLAEALARLAREESGAEAGGCLPWRAVFAGGDRVESGGSNREGLVRMFARDGLTGRVELPGFVAQDELVELYRCADICVVPSTLYESFSYTCVQAMACGRPVIATTMGGIPETVADGETGLLIPPGDPIALADALRRLIDDVSLRQRLGAAGRVRVERLYSADVVARQNLDLYERVVARRAWGRRQP